MEIKHKNGVKNDSRVENLEYVTSSGNKRHVCRTGLRKAKLPERDLDEIKAALLAGESARGVAQQYYVSRQAILPRD